MENDDIHMMLGELSATQKAMHADIKESKIDIKALDTKLDNHITDYTKLKGKVIAVSGTLSVVVSCLLFAGKTVLAKIIGK